MSKAKRSGSRRGTPSRTHEDSSANSPLTQMLQMQRKLLSAGIDSFSPDAIAAGRAHMKGVTGPLQDGFRKLEQVFDDRVAAALQRIGMPSAETLRELIDRVDRLSPPARPTRRNRK